MSTIDNRYGETVADIATVAPGICAALGGKGLAFTGAEDAARDPTYLGATFMVGDDVVVRLSCGWPDRKRLTVSVDLTLAAFPRHCNASTGSRHKLENITVSPSRPAATLAKDIGKRLLEANTEALEARRELARNMADTAERMDALKARAAATVPALQVTVSDDGQQASVYFNRDGVYLTGRIYGDGQLSLDRVGGFSLEMLAPILNALPNS